MQSPFCFFGRQIKSYEQNRENRPIVTKDDFFERTSLIAKCATLAFAEFEMEP